MSDEPSYTINEFCALEKLSRSQLYKLWGEGKGPRFYKIGNRPRISSAARREWRREMESTERDREGK